jgi:hypothetical protein
MMRRLMAGLVLVAVLAACGGNTGDGGTASEGAAAPTDTPTLEPAGGEGVAGGGSAGACAAILEFEGETYDGYSVNKPAESGEPLGEAVFPPCNDTGGSDEAAETVEVVAIKGVNPDRAVKALSNENMVWVRQGRSLPDALQPLTQ